MSTNFKLRLGNRRVVCHNKKEFEMADKSSVAVGLVGGDIWGERESLIDLMACDAGAVCH